jgi:hypothetical protein
VTVRRAIEDPSGRPVELTEERWRHVVARHPEIEALETEVLRAVASPDRVLPGRFANESWSYAATEGPSAWLKVVVAYAEGRGYIVTAYGRRAMP